MTISPLISFGAKLLSVALVATGLLVDSSQPVLANAPCGGASGFYWTNYRGNSKNPVRGGFVADTAYVEDGVWLGPEASICEYATVYDGRIVGRAVIKGRAQIKGGVLTEKTVIGGDAIVENGHFSGTFEAFTGSFVEQNRYYRPNNKQNKVNNDVSVSRLIKQLNSMDHGVSVLGKSGGSLGRISHSYSFKNDSINECEIVEKHTTVRKNVASGSFFKYPYSSCSVRYDLADVKYVSRVAESKVNKKSGFWFLSTNHKPKKVRQTCEERRQYRDGESKTSETTSLEDWGVTIYFASKKSAQKFEINLEQIVSICKGKR